MITETETAFLAVIRAFLTEEKASPAEIQGLTEKQWNHLFVLAAQHSLLSAVYDVVGKTPEFAELPDELRRQVKTQAMQSVLQQVSRTASGRAAAGDERNCVQKSLSEAGSAPVRG